MKIGAKILRLLTKIFDFLHSLRMTRFLGALQYFAARPYAKIFASTEIFSYGRFLSEKRAFSVKFFTKSASKILYFATLRIFF